MAKKRESWQKTLYGNYGYPDNYTDRTFLKDLQTNKNVKIFTLAEAVSGAARLNNQITCVTMFLIVFHNMSVQSISAMSVLALGAVITLLGYILYVWRRHQLFGGEDFEDCKTVFCVLFFGYLMSPMLHTLTNSVSTDTIFTMTFFVLIVHVIFFDYGLPAFIVSKTISLNAAIFGSICLASRLATPTDAFALLVVASAFFALLPILVRELWTPVLLLPIVAICSYFLYWTSGTALCIYLLLMVFINGLCPYIFVFQQKYKNNIHGPWDEAIVRDADILLDSS